ncbi:MAG: peptidoglycan-binding protein [Pseudomonadales bacterium]|nr:peptidoglycan-binding protein [Pseudomonadales bacterium]
MNRLLILTILGLFYSQLSLAHEAVLNAVGCHIQPSTNVRHCHKDGDYTRKVKKKTSFSGQESQAPVRMRYDRELVKAIQQQLSVAGYHVGSVDGIFGGKTRKAIFAFQKKNAFKVTGQPSEYVLSKLRDYNRLK